MLTFRKRKLKDILYWNDLQSKIVMLVVGAWFKSPLFQHLKILSHFRAEQRVSSSLIGWAIPDMMLYFIYSEDITPSPGYLKEERIFKMTAVVLGPKILSRTRWSPAGQTIKRNLLFPQTQATHFLTTMAIVNEDNNDKTKAPGPMNSFLVVFHLFVLQPMCCPAMQLRLCLFFLKTFNSRKGQRTNQKYRNLVGSDQQMQWLPWRNWTQKGWPYGWGEL